MTNTVLKAINIDAGYQAQAVVRQLNLDVGAGEMVCLLGPNGAGKTTTLQTLAGDLALISGEVQLFGKPCTAPLYQRVRQGLAYITDERTIVMGLTVRDNLRLKGGSIEDAIAFFPELTALLEREASLLSGGQQQIVSVARCLAAKPKLLIADELSMGLAPQIVDRLLLSLRQACNQGLAVLLVEQHIDKALAHSDRGYVMTQGQIVINGDSDTLKQQRTNIEQAYINHSQVIAS